MTEIPTVKPLVKAGDHLFGFATATCPDCSRTRSYWVYIEYGVGGWTAELTGGQLPNLVELFKAIPAISANRDKALYEIAPVTHRNSIKHWP
jgi:hypothetical protein